jgi:hypothetical protein
VPHPERVEREVARDEPVDPAVVVEQQLALEDIERLLVRVDVALEPAPGLERAERRCAGLTSTPSRLAALCWSRVTSGSLVSFAITAIST